MNTIQQEANELADRIRNKLTTDFNGRVHLKGENKYVLDEQVALFGLSSFKRGSEYVIECIKTVIDNENISDHQLRNKINELIKYLTDEGKLQEQPNVSGQI